MQYKNVESGFFMTKTGDRIESKIDSIRVKLNSIEGMVRKNDKRFVGNPEEEKAGVYEMMRVFDNRVALLERYMRYLATIVSFIIIVLLGLFLGFNIEEMFVLLV